MKDTTNASKLPPLLQQLYQLLQAHRGAFDQDRPFWRAVGLVFGQLFAFGRHTLTQELLALGVTEGDWSAWYRLFSHQRFHEERMANILLRETLQEVGPDQPYVVGCDGTHIERSSLKMPGTSWMKGIRTAKFKPGIQRGQRFLHGAWLAPIQEGYSRAIPLRFLPAFPPKAVASPAPARSEWQAGMEYLKWVRAQLDQAGREQQSILAVADGAFDVIDLWNGLPQHTYLLVRTAKNRKLLHLPGEYGGRGRPAEYGDMAPKPQAYLHSREKWEKQTLTVRHHTFEARFVVRGPFLREGAPDVPLFLIVVKGFHRRVGKRVKRWKHRPPSFFLVSALAGPGGYQLPLPIEELLMWLWQRWELEVAHREMKSGFGVGEKQCWQFHASILAVQWSVWVYAVLLLAGLRTWGLLGGKAPPSPWWRGSKRWSLNTLWRAYRAELWGEPEFRALWTTTGDNWLKKETGLAGLFNSVGGSTRT